MTGVRWKDFWGNTFVRACTYGKSAAAQRETAGNADYCSGGIPCLERRVTPRLSSPLAGIPRPPSLALNPSVSLFDMQQRPRYPRTALKQLSRMHFTPHAHVCAREDFETGCGWHITRAQAVLIKHFNTSTHFHACNINHCVLQHFVLLLQTHTAIWVSHTAHNSHTYFTEQWSLWTHPLTAWDGNTHAQLFVCAYLLCLN